MIRDDSWDLIPDIPSNQLLQPTPKSCPLRRPEFDFRPRLPAVMHVSARPPICDTRFQPSGPRLTLAGISSAVPTVVPGYEPIRSGLSHHVSHVACPYERVTRTEYHPASLQMRSSSSALSETCFGQDFSARTVPKHSCSFAMPPS